MTTMDRGAPDSTAFDTWRVHPTAARHLPQPRRRFAEQPALAVAAASVTLAMIACVGCTARHVVVEPDQVASLKSPQWTVTSAPRDTAPPSDATGDDQHPEMPASTLP
jgi:hypothetical protein